MKNRYQEKFGYPIPRTAAGQVRPPLAPFFRLESSSTFAMPRYSA